MSPPLRKFVLLTHVTSSVGWLGAVVVFAGLAGVALTSEDAATLRGAYLVMAPAGAYVLVPLAFASLLTGLVQSLGGTWGLFRHYWVLFKLLINVFAAAVLLLYLQTLGYLADAAADPTRSVDQLRALGASPLLHAALAVLALLAATVLSVYKPKGMTPYGRRRHRRTRAARAGQPVPS